MGSEARRTESIAEVGGAELLMVKGEGEKESRKRAE
jgi:hypothetical protein